MWLGLNTSLTRDIALSFASVLGMQDGASLFSVGTGCGNMEREVVKEWPGVVPYGTDFSKNGVSYASEWMPTGTFCVGDIRNMTWLPQDRFDFVWTHGVLWYIYHSTP